MDEVFGTHSLISAGAVDVATEEFDRVVKGRLAPHSARWEVAQVLGLLGKHGDAEREYRELITHIRDAGELYSHRHSLAVSRLAVSLNNQGRFDEAVTFFREALEGWPADDPDHERLWLQFDLARLYVTAQRWELADRELLDVQMRCRAIGEEAADLLDRALWRSSQVLDIADQLDQVLLACRERLALEQKNPGDEGRSRVLATRERIIYLAEKVSEIDKSEAIEQLEELVSEVKDHFGDDSLNALWTTERLAELQEESRDLTGAEIRFHEVVRKSRECHPRRSVFRFSLWGLSRLMVNRQRHDEALLVLEELLERELEVWDEDGRDPLMTKLRMVTCRYKIGELTTAAAASEFRSLLTKLEQKTDEDAFTRNARQELARMEQELKQPPGAGV
ncbi:tetratricopeptide repeat protein [Lentzea sp. NPDC102401]|uniref:tetratricopeptide repeat protein n=1 Tax=Lentzea sp. NPDC102401 TaxID=3364128 RepID=UPI003812BCEF